MLETGETECKSVFNLNNFPLFITISVFIFTFQVSICVFKVFVERLSTPMYTKYDEYHFEYIHRQPSNCRTFSISLVSSIVNNCHNCADHHFLSVFSSTHSYLIILLYTSILQAYMIRIQQ